MKNIANKEVNYSLHNIDNFKKELDSEISDVVDKLSELLLEYFKFIIENIKLKQSNFFKFLIIRGLDTIINVFNFMLFYTKNLDLTYFHCQKSFYLYVEFVGQISEDEKIFLQLNSRDASIYVYKKTIFEISYEFKKKNETISDYTKFKLDIINSYRDLYKTFLLKLMISDDITDTIICDNNLKIIEELYKNLNNIANKSVILKINDIIEKLFYNIEKAVDLYEIINILLKKYIKNKKIINIVHDKLIREDYKIKSFESCDKIVTWLFS
jgi:hypothetical protein